MRRAVKRLRIGTGAHKRLHEIEHAVVDDRGPADPLDVRSVVDDLARRAHLPLQHIVPDGCNTIVKVFMALFIFLSAAAPA